MTKKRSGWPMSRLEMLRAAVTGYRRCELWECWIIDHERYRGAIQAFLAAAPELRDHTGPFADLGHPLVKRVYAVYRLAADITGYGRPEAR